MVKIIGVRFRRAGKIYYFDPGDLDIKAGQHIIVETARGVEYGTVSIAPREVDDSSVVQPLKKVIRIATVDDDDINEGNRIKEREAYKICLEKIKKYGLQMKLIDVEYTFDNNKILFYFTADGRIDFRELVKDLASVFKTRIELRQVGVRDETKMRGGIGICGRDLCCYSYMSDFVPVSIKMAKEQTLSLNPAKISGVCGRLMCCLKYEQETYEWLNSKLPNIGDYVTTFDGFEGTVSNINVMRQRVRVVVNLENDAKEARDYSVDQIKFKKGRRYPDKKKETALEDGAGIETETRENERSGNSTENKDGDTHAAQRTDRRNHNKKNRFKSEQAGSGEKYPRGERRSRRNRRRNDRDTAGRAD